MEEKTFGSTIDEKRSLLEGVELVVGRGGQAQTKIFLIINFHKPYATFTMAIRSYLVLVCHYIMGIYLSNDRTTFVSNGN